MDELEPLLEALRVSGLLLLQDGVLPNVAALVAGEPVSGSWWGHPRGGAIFRLAGALEDHPDVAVSKLVSGKVTFVHRRLFGALLGVATSGEAWQIAGLSAAARFLLDRVLEAGLVRTDDLGAVSGEKPGPLAKALEARLLVYASEVHTESGAHARVLRSWAHWAEEAGIDGGAIGPDEAKRALEEAADRLRRGVVPELPWRSPPRSRRGRGRRGGSR